MSSHYDNQFLLIKLILLLLISLKNQPRIIFNIINEVQSTYETQFTGSLAILAGPCLLIPTGWTHSRRLHYIMGTQGVFPTRMLGFCKAAEAAPSPLLQRGPHRRQEQLMPQRLGELTNTKTGQEGNCSPRSKRFWARWLLYSLQSLCRLFYFRCCSAWT